MMIGGGHGARARSWSGIWVVVTAVVLLGTARQVLDIPWPVAPQNTAHAINKTYGDWNGYRFSVDTIPLPPNPPAQPETMYATNICYHTGVDIPANSGTAVLAVFDGYVRHVKRYTHPDSAYLGYVCVARTLNGNPWWDYGHVIRHDSMQAGRPISTADTLGFVAKFVDGTNNHLHFYLEEQVGILTRSVCNPLDSVVPAPSQDVPFAQRTPVGRHKCEIEYVRDKRGTIQLAQTLWDTTQQEYLLRDSVDVVAGAIAVLEGNFSPIVQQAVLARNGSEVFLAFWA